MTSEYAAAPRRWITGMDIGTAPGVAERTAAGLKRKVDRRAGLEVVDRREQRHHRRAVPGGHPRRLRRRHRQFTQQASAISGLAPAYLGIHGSEVASADAIRLSEATLVS